MSPTTLLASVASTRSIRFAASRVAVALKEPGTPNVIVRPWIAPLPAIAALTTPCGVDHSWNCRSASVIGADVAVSPVTFQAASPLRRKITFCSPRTYAPPPLGGSSVRV
jgi:hypothetical protein